MGFWIGIVISVLIIVGASVIVGSALNRRGLTRRQHKQVTMAKASGAFRHRKSNR
ncbi:MAG: hypothetical protein AB7P07_13475 [Hyphomonadaceae bacterium]